MDSTTIQSQKFSSNTSACLPWRYPSSSRRSFEFWRFANLSLIILFLIVAIIPTHSLEANNGHHQHNLRKASEQQQRAETELQEDDRKQQRVQMLVEETTAETDVPGRTTPGRDLFREYLSRGIFTCTTKYVGILRKLNKLISTAHAEYSHCQMLVSKADHEKQNGKFQEQLEMINELLLD